MLGQYAYGYGYGERKEPVVNLHLSTLFFSSFHSPSSSHVNVSFSPTLLLFPASLFYLFFSFVLPSLTSSSSSIVVVVVVVREPADTRTRGCAYRKERLAQNRFFSSSFGPCAEFSSSITLDQQEYSSFHSLRFPLFRSLVWLLLLVHWM